MWALASLRYSSVVCTRRVSVRVRAAPPRVPRGLRPGWLPLGGGRRSWRTCSSSSSRAPLPGLRAAAVRHAAGCRTLHPRSARRGAALLPPGLVAAAHS
eukprot:15044049-Alexandrium_andersonii.AAC.1